MPRWFVIGAALFVARPLAADDRIVLPVAKGVSLDYVVRDDDVLRPYFCNLKTLSGKSVTRSHPLVEGVDPGDHPTMHPGLWLAFGDVDGRDFWRNRGRVRQLGVVEEPSSESGRTKLVVRNAYDAGGQTLCTEVCRIEIEVRDRGYLIAWDSTFTTDREQVTFGDQEEMGLGIRLATPLTVEHGNGAITDSDGRRNGKEVWGHSAKWCDYSGAIVDERVGVVLMPHPENFRPSWFHARDYGLLVANPFGRNALTGGEKSQIVVKRGERLRLRFGIYVYSAPESANVEIDPVYRAYIAR